MPFIIYLFVKVILILFRKGILNLIKNLGKKIGNDFFVIMGLYEKNLREEKIICSFKKGQKKIVKRNGKAYKKISKHIGMIPTVIISPADSDLIMDGSNTRRKFIDSVISQTYLFFLNNLLEYNKILSQRNSLLKYFALNNTYDSNTLQIYNDQLVKRSQIIYKKRKAFMDNFIPVFSKIYKNISQGNESVSLSYISQLRIKPFKSSNESLERIRFQYTTTGPHKDDIILFLNDKPIKV